MLSSMTEPTDDDALLKVTQAAGKLGISRRKLMELIYTGEIETIRLPSKRTGLPYEHRIEPAEIQRFIDRNRQRASA